MLLSRKELQLVCSFRSSLLFEKFFTSIFDLVFLFIACLHVSNCHEFTFVIVYRAVTSIDEMKMISHFLKMISHLLAHSFWMPQFSGAGGFLFFHLNITAFSRLTHFCVNSESAATDEFILASLGSRQFGSLHFIRSFLAFLFLHCGLYRSCFVCLPHIRPRFCLLM